MATNSPVAQSAALESLAQETSKVLDQHLGAFAKGLDAILEDYTQDSILITPDRNFAGLDEIRSFFKGFLDGAAPEFWGAFTLDSRVVHGEIGYITWAAAPFVTIATDTVLVRDGKILVQTFTSYTG